MADIISGTKPGVATPSQSSAPQNTSVGSGSRPTRSSISIEDSAPMDGRTLDRSPPRDWLK